VLVDPRRGTLEQPAQLAADVLIELCLDGRLKLSDPLGVVAIVVVVLDYPALLGAEGMHGNPLTAFQVADQQLPGGLAYAHRGALIRHRHRVLIGPPADQPGLVGPALRAGLSLAIEAGGRWRRSTASPGRGHAGLGGQRRSRRRDSPA